MPSVAKPLVPSPNSTSSTQSGSRVVAELERVPIPQGTLLNLNCPVGDVKGARPARLGKRIYNDRMELTEEQDGRRRYRIYGEMPGYQPEDGTDFAAIADGCIAVTPIHFDLTDEAGVEELERVPIPEGTLLNVNCPVGEVGGARPARLGKRIYNDRMELTEEQDGRRRYRIYGEMPGYQHEDGTDFAAIADGCIAVTPLHFDLTDEAGIEALSGFDLDGLIQPAAREVE